MSATSHYKLGRRRKVSIEKLSPSPENSDLYDLPTDDNTKDLQDQITDRGLEEAILISKDYYVISGHRRLKACQCLGWDSIDAKYLSVKRDELSQDEWRQLLAKYNVSQRDKTIREKANEQWAVADLTPSYRHFVPDTAQRYKDLTMIDYSGTAKRYGISDEKQSFVNSIKEVVFELKEYWPITVRAIHYNLLKRTPRPIRNTRRKDQDYTYQNDFASYKDLVRQTPRMRFFGIIPEKAIYDPTRDTTTFKGFHNVGHFLKHEKDKMFDLYHRDLLQSQDQHFEFIAEKLTVQSYLQRVVQQYKINLTISRGSSSFAARGNLASRFKRSGKKHLTLLCMFDFDPDGEQLAAVWKEYLQYDYGIKCDAVKVALNKTQADEFELIKATHDEDQDGLHAKKDSPNYQRFIDKYGDDTVYELEAMTPQQMQEAAQEAITTVLDMDLFEQEKRIEEQEINGLESLRHDVSDHVTRVIPNHF